MNPSGRVALVTGGAGNLGREIVRRLAAQGAQVVVVDRDPERVAVLAADPDFAGVSCRVADLVEPAAVNALLEAIASEVGPVAILVNCAGMIASAPLVNPMARSDRAHALSLWNTVIEANLTTTFVVTAAVVDRMLGKRVKGVVVNLSSVSAAGNPGQSAYSAAKAGVNALTRAWAKELAPMGIRVVAIAPGFSDTHSTAMAMDPAVLARAIEKVPLRRLGTAEEVVSAVCFAIENDFVTGTVIEVDGGLVI